MPDIEGQFSQELKRAQPEELSDLAERAAREARRVQDVAALREENDSLKREQVHLRVENERKDVLIASQLESITNLDDKNREQRDRLDAIGELLATMERRLGRGEGS